MKSNNHLYSLKNIWNNLNFRNPIIESSEIFLLIKKSSSSIVKKILIISILEFSISLIIPYFIQKQDYYKPLLEIEKNVVLVFLEYLYYLVFVYFLIQFFMNYKKIDTNSSLFYLSKNILKTRKSVYNYVISSLFLYNANSIVFAYLFLNESKLYKELILKNDLGQLKLFVIIYYSSIIIITIICSLLIWYIYKILYLKLINKLNENFKELNK